MHISNRLFILVIQDNSYLDYNKLQARAKSFSLTSSKFISKNVLPDFLVFVKPLKHLEYLFHKHKSRFLI